MGIYIYIYIYICIYKIRARCDTRSIFKRSVTSLNLDFSFFLTGYHLKVKEPNLSFYLPIISGRIIESIPPSKVLMLCEV